MEKIKDVEEEKEQEQFQHPDPASLRKPNLRRLRNLEFEHDVATVATPQNAQPPKSRKKTKTEPPKIEPTEPAFIGEMAKLAAAEEPPVYSTQGQDIGRAGRGRKPKKNSEEKLGKGKKRESGKRGGKRGGQKKNSKTTKKRITKNTKKTTKVVGKFRKLKKCRGKTVGQKNVIPSEAQTPEPPADENPEEEVAEGFPEEEVAEGVPVHHGPKRAPPAHITSHHAYSSAYRKAQSASFSADYCRVAGQMAAKMLRETGHVDDLCGTFRATKRRANGKGGEKDDSQQAELAQ